MAKKNGAKAREKEPQRDLFCRLQDAFRVAARKTSAVLGTAWAFMAAVGIIVVWGATGHIFHYSDTWQLIINTGTTIVTFLMVFLIQNTQNRDSRAAQLNKLMDLEALSDEDLDDFQKEFERLRKRSERTAEAVERIDEKTSSR